MTTDKELIEYQVSQLEAASPGMVYAGRTHAYAAFTDGKLIFDIEPQPNLVTKFSEEVRSEFGAAMVWNTINRPGQSIYCVYNKDLYQKRREQETLWRLEAEHPGHPWFSGGE